MDPLKVLPTPGFGPQGANQAVPQQQQPLPVPQEEFSRDAQAKFGIEDQAKNFIKEYANEKGKHFRQVPIRGKFNLQELSEYNEKLLVLFQMNPKESYGIYMPLKANFRFND